MRRKSFYVYILFHLLMYLIIVFFSNEFSSLKYLESAANLEFCYLISKKIHIDGMEKRFLITF